MIRDYQSEAINKTRAALDAGARGVCIVAPTGSGKTLIGRQLSGQRTLWLAHRVELVEQARRQGVRAETVQSKPSLEGIDLLILDECHHYAADTWFSAVGDIRRIGLTATPQRSDGRGLGCLFDTLVVAATIRELTERGILAPLTIVRPDRCLDAGQIACDPVEAYLRYTPNSKAVVFCPSIRAATDICSRFLHVGIRCGLVHSQMRDDGMWRSCKVVCNVNVLTEGWDDPSVDTCILARGVSNSGTLIQMAGRVLRAKTVAWLLDLRGITHVFGDPTSDQAYSLNGLGMRPKYKGYSFCALCGVPIGTYPCLECGYTPPEPELPSVVGAELRYALKRSETIEERRATYHRWLAVAKAKGYKNGHAMWKYKAVYGHWPPKEVMR